MSGRRLGMWSYTGLRTRMRAAAPTDWRAFRLGNGEALPLIVEGKTTKDIATRLGAAVGTIHSQRQAIMQKLSVKNTVDAIKVALANRFQAGSQ